MSVSCPECGQAATPDDRFCGRCGAPLATTRAEEEGPGSDGRSADPSERTLGRRGRWIPALGSVACVLVVLIIVVVPRSGEPRSIAPRGEPGSTGYFPVAAVDVSGESWRTEPVRGTAALQHVESAVAVGPTVVTAVDAGLVGLAARDGTMRWRTPLGEATGRPVAIEGVVVVPVGGDVVAVDPEDGAVRWRAEFDGPMTEVVAASGATLVVVAGADEHGAGGALIGLDVDDGGRLWTGVLADGAEIAPWTPPGGPQATATDGAGVVRIAETVTVDKEMPDGSVQSHPLVQEGPLVALDLRSGEERWRTGSSPAAFGVGDDLVVTAAREVDEEGRVELLARNVMTGSVEWRADGVSAPQSIAVVDDAVYAATRGGLVVLDSDDGTERDRIPGPDGMSTLFQTGRHLLVDAAGELAIVDLISGERIWEQDRDRGSTPGPGAITEDVVVLAAPEGLVAHDLGSGAELWRLSSRAVGGCEILRFGGELVVATAGHVLTLDPATGELRDDPYAEPPSLRAAPAVGGSRVSSVALVEIADEEPDAPSHGSDGTRMVATVGPADRRGAARLRGWSADGDEPRWDVELRRFAPSLLGGGTDLVLRDGGSQPEVTAVEPRDGAERWSRRVNGPAEAEDADQPAPDAGALVAAGGRLIVADGSGAIVAWDLASGEELWRSDLPLDPGSFRAVARDDIVLVTSHDVAVVLDGDDGEVRWTQEFDGAAFTPRPRGAYAGSQLIVEPHRPSPALAGHVALVPGDGGLIAFDIATGERRWTADLRTEVLAGISIAGDRIYAATARGLELLDLETGEASSEVLTDRLITAPPFVDGDRVYVCLSDGTVSAHE